MSNTCGAGAGGEGDLRSPVRASDRVTALGQVKDTVGRYRASGRQVTAPSRTPVGSWTRDPRLAPC